MSTKKTFTLFAAFSVRYKSNMFFFRNVKKSFANYHKFSNKYEPYQKYKGTKYDKNKIKFVHKYLSQHS